MTTKMENEKNGRFQKLVWNLTRNRNFHNRVLPWRNWLARSTVNRKVGGSSPPGSDLLEQNFYRRILVKIGLDASVFPRVEAGWLVSLETTLFWAFPTWAWFP